MAKQPKQPLVMPGPGASGYVAPISLDAVDNTAAPDADGHGHNPPPAPIPPQPPGPQPQPPPPAYVPPPPSPAAQSPKYVESPDGWREWIQPATDVKGHGSKQAFRVQPGVARQAELAVASGQFPYRTSADLMRHAVYRHLHWLATINEFVPSVLTQVDSIMEIIRDDQLLQEQQDVLARLATQAEKHYAAGDVLSARRIITSALASIDAMPPGAWRDSYRVKFETMFHAEYPTTANAQAQAQGGRRNR